MRVAIIVTLFLSGVILLGAEVFVPGGILGALGGLAMLAGCVLAFLDFGFVGGLSSAGIGVALIGLMLWAEFVVLPKTRAGKKLFLEAEVKGASQGAVADADAVIGKAAVAATVLSPSGYVEVEGRRYEAFSQSGFVEKGGRLVVVALDNFRLIVRKN